MLRAGTWPGIAPPRPALPCPALPCLRTYLVSSAGRLGLAAALLLVQIAFLHRARGVRGCSSGTPQNRRAVLLRSVGLLVHCSLKDPRGSARQASEAARGLSQHSGRHWMVGGEGVVGAAA